jgi:hypothetical protein
MDDVEERLPPADAFSLVGHELRFRILDELSRADQPLAFSELRARVGVEDPGQFNYHLGELAGRFVRNTDDGYAATTAGRRVVGSVLSGALTKQFDVEPIDLAADCSRCGTPLELEFEDAHTAVVCDDCGYTVLHVAPPAGVFENCDRADLPDVVDRWLNHRLATLDNGFCLDCAAPLEPEVLPEDHPEAPDWVSTADHGPAVQYLCDRCERSWLATVAPMLLRCSPVVAFYYDHGNSELESPAWLDTRAAESESRIVGRDPLRVEVTFYCEDDELAVTVDETLTVVDTERS